MVAGFSEKLPEEKRETGLNSFIRSKGPVRQPREKRPGKLDYLLKRGGLAVHPAQLAGDDNGTPWIEFRNFNGWLSLR